MNAVKGSRRIMLKQLSGIKKQQIKEMLVVKPISACAMNLAQEFLKIMLKQWSGIKKQPVKIMLELKQI